MRLTDISIRNLPQPPKGQRTYFDDTLKSFGCRVSQGGTRSFVLQHGAERRLTTIGRYPVISLSEARSAAKRILAERTLGKHQPRSVAWDEAYKLFIGECAEQIRPRTVASYSRLLTRHFPFGRKRLSEVMYEDIERKLSGLKHVPAERNHALVACKVFLRWAQRPPRRFIQTNPCEGMVPTKRPSRKRTLNTFELSKVYQAALNGAGRFNCIIGLLLLTGQRRGEIASLRWEWIDTKERTVTLPDSVTKNHREHTFPYGDAVSSLLDRIPQTSEYVFPSHRDHVRGIPTTTFNAWTKSKAAFDEACGVSGYTLHDLRRTFATNLAELGVAPHVIERLLNHSTGTLSPIALVYNRATYLKEMREAIACWEIHLKRVLETQDVAATPTNAEKK